MVISHNIMAMNSQLQLNKAVGVQKKSTEKLSSGYRINRAADDAAGLAISEKMRAKIRGLCRGSDNIEDGVSYVQVADGALHEVHDMLQRLNVLSVQSANGTNSESDRKDLQHEVEQIKKEIDRISETTTFNGEKIFITPYHVEGLSLHETLVESPSAEKGKLSEGYYGPDKKWHSAATIDFSKINKSNISFLYNKSFSFNCSQSCDEAFTFKFIDGNGSSHSVSNNLSQKANHVYTIDIGGCSSGEQVIDRLYNYVKNNMPTTGGAGSFHGDLYVSHSNVMGRTSPSSIVIYATATNSSKADAEGVPYKGVYGNVDISQVASYSFVSLKKIYKPESIKIQCSNDATDILTMKKELMNTEFLGINDMDISTEHGANYGIEQVDGALEYVSRMRSLYGAYQNRLEHSYENNRNKEENTTAAESRIRDTNMAKEMVNYSKNNILLQAGQAVLSQAQSSKEGVMSLL